ncbi:hypothetical protein [Aneurinibacillus terranovensis]|uniref:hypothetical protein n=1 Tax=Aneurinibacillus terranovensis TaxID=278991 RepID=UPI0005580677
MDRNARSNVASSAVTVKDFTLDMAKELKKDSQGFVDKIQEKSQVISSIAQEASKSIQQIADKAVEAKDYSAEAISVAKQAKKTLLYDSKQENIRSGWLVHIVIRLSSAATCLICSGRSTVQATNSMPLLIRGRINGSFKSK